MCPLRGNLQVQGVHAARACRFGESDRAVDGGSGAFPGRAEQARALGIWAAVSAIAVLAGPLLGGFLMQSYGWRSVLWINPPVVAVCIIGVIFWVKAAHGRRERRLDLGVLSWERSGSHRSSTQ